MFLWEFHLIGLLVPKMALSKAAIVTNFGICSNACLYI